MVWQVAAARVLVLVRVRAQIPVLLVDAARVRGRRRVEFRERGRVRVRGGVGEAWRARPAEVGAGCGGEVGEAVALERAHRGSGARQPRSLPVALAAVRSRRVFDACACVQSREHCR